MKNKSEAILYTLIIVVVVLLVNALANMTTASIDLTEEKRFSLSESTKEVIESVEEPLLVRVLLSGDFPAGFEQLEEAIQSLLQQYQSFNSNIQFVFEDPSEGSNEEINSRYENLREIGILPTNLVVQDNGEVSEKLVFPYALISYGDKRTIVNLLKAQDANESEDLTLNKSVALLEYKMADQIYKMTRADKPNIVLLDGRGELQGQQTAALENGLRKNYDIGRLHLDSLYQLSPEIDLLIVARPTEEYSDRDQLILDQYIMNGGNVIWLIEKYDANVFKIDTVSDYVPREIVHNLDDLFFDYGIRYRSNLLLDLQCSQVPQVVAVQGGKPQTQLFPWFYHPILTGSDQHPITNNISNLNLTFPSEIEILERPNVSTQVLLSTSSASRYQVYPMNLTFDVVRLGEDPSKFDKGRKIIAVLAEGEFSSHYKNRLSKSQQETLQQLGTPFVDKSSKSKQLWISDVYLISNLYNPSNNRISPIGYNQWEQRTYEGNAEFIKNAIDYMVDEINVMEARNKDVKLRLLNRAKVIKEKTQWQLINMVLPLILLGIFGLCFSLVRKRRYAN